MKKDNEIFERVFDNYTMKTLILLRRKKKFDSLEFPISTGKEADVYRATTTIKGKEGFVAIKIYRIETSNFKAMQNYLIGDPRFENVKKTKRGVINAWCQKEYKNLIEATKAKVRVPKPLGSLNNVLIMEFIGENGSPAQMLKKTKIKKPEKLIKTLSEDVKRLWKKRLVHGDLSEFNILIDKNEEPVLIDWGQAMSTKHPIALELLKRDLLNLKKIAEKHGVDFDYEKMLSSIV